MTGSGGVHDLKRDDLRSLGGAAQLVGVCEEAYHPLREKLDELGSKYQELIDDANALNDELQQARAPLTKSKTKQSTMRKALAAEKGTVTMDGLTSIMKKVHADTIVKTKVYLFNVLKNPFERTDKECDDVEECHSLYLLDDFAETSEKLEKKWTANQQEMVHSHLQRDDGGQVGGPAARQ